jgi:succinate dehydrogenase/fumarate reductase flavoprotein subunit
MTSAPTLAGLAAQLGIPGDALEETVARFNANAREGQDPDFNRGSSAHDRWWGDGSLRDEGAKATLAPLEKPPFYAIQVFSGALGTKGGPLTDTRARVLDVDGDVIPGLYAAGNAMSSPLGMTYGGAGGTLGPAMVFGYLAGRHIAERVGGTSAVAAAGGAPAPLAAAPGAPAPLAAAHGGA